MPMKALIAQAASEAASVPGYFFLSRFFSV
jgi:hypothetical protein